MTRLYWSAPTLAGDIRQSGFVYYVNGTLNTFNPQMASSGLTVDTLAAQLYDRLLDVDPYTYRLQSIWAAAVRTCGITVPLTVFTCVIGCSSSTPQPSNHTAP
ncbi:hypothetical protein WDV93_14275 [Pantoea ananatis]